MKHYCKVPALEITIDCNFHCDDQSLIEICSSAVHIILIHVPFLSRVEMNSTNWPALNVWVFIAQLVEHCSANAEAVDSNPVEVSKCLLLKLQLPSQRSYLLLNIIVVHSDL